jgi:general secretion pathway protein H
MSATGDATAGFTLLETLTALAITALVSLIALPNLGKAMEAVTLAQSKAAVLSDLAVARAQAQRSGAPVGLTVQPDGTGYAWTDGPQRQMPAGVRLASEGGTLVTFYPDGSAAGGQIQMSMGDKRVRLAIGPSGASWALAAQ